METALIFANRTRLLYKAYIVFHFDSYDEKF